jgi:hypothetical protein
MMFHVLVYGFATYISNDALKFKAYEHCAALMTEVGDPRAIIEPIKEIFAVTSPDDTTLRRQLLQWCASTGETIASVDSCAELRNLFAEHEPLAWLLQKDAQSLRVCEELERKVLNYTIAELRDELKDLLSDHDNIRADQERERQFALDAIDLMDQQARCRNSSCTVQFGARLAKERSGTPALRCERCNCRHTLAHLLLSGTT